MKKIFALLFAALSVAFFACGDEKTDNGNDWFLAPAASADGTTVELTCLTRFGDGVLEELGAGFACAELTGGSLGEFVDYKDVTVDGSRLSARVSGLRPRTTYIFYAFAELRPDVSGVLRLRSTPARKAIPIRTPTLTPIPIRTPIRIPG